MKHKERLENALNSLSTDADTLRHFLKNKEDPEYLLDAIERYHADLKHQMQQISYFKHQLKQEWKKRNQNTIPTTVSKTQEKDASIPSSSSS